ncbi:cache domain-containing protein [Noviherbaspirillum saxi]|uniref:Histidine kinase n=1 Tax=Noviherbaspirillum saxi TaxID=2320863 RepID=A0A3A3G911_9BURK|nr:cache domain-containing protein [Noviherbaspirillum saxi]RJF98635.1 histidine kinase [Noviherbaspirillum saxi]
MKKLLASILLVLTSSLGFAAERGTPDEAVALVQKVISSLKQNGRDKTIEEINNKSAKYLDKDLYVAVLDLNGVVLANGTFPKLIGKDVLLMKDADGRAFIKDGMEVVKTKGKGWIDYKWPNPATGNIEHKSTYMEQVGDVVINCGIYKGK